MLSVKAMDTNWINGTDRQSMVELGISRGSAKHNLNVDICVFARLCLADSLKTWRKPPHLGGIRVISRKETASCWSCEIE